MSEKRSIGITSIEIGPIGATGAMGTTLAVLGKTYKDSAELMQDDPTLTDIESEEDDDPIETIMQKGKTTLKFSIMDYTPETLVKVLGGTVTGTAPNTVWEAPATAEDIQRSVKVTTKTGIVMSIVRAQIIAKLNAKLSKTGVALVDIQCRVMTPTLADTAPLTITPPAA